MNILIEIENGMSICSINGNDYPVARLDEEYIAVTAASESAADNIALRANGDKHPTTSKYSPFEVWISRDRFDKIIELSKWSKLGELL